MIATHHDHDKYLTMARGKELTPEARARICELRSIGWSYNKIHEFHPEIPRSTIRYTCGKEKERLQQRSKPRLGQPRKITEDERDRMLEIVEFDDPFIKWRDLTRTCENAKERAVRKLMSEMGYRKWRTKKRPHLTAAHAAARLQWARKYEQFTPQEWRRVVWSDECSIERGVGAQQRWVFMRPSEQLLHPEILHDSTRHCGKGVKKMFWAAFCYARRTALVPMNGDPDARSGGVTARVYREVLNEHLQTILNADSIFMHDNAPIHTAHIIQGFFNMMAIEVMDWPPYSPDLNPIENLWSVLKQAIYERYPALEHAIDSVQTLERLIEAAMEVWEVVEQRVHYNLSDSMPRRVAAVIAAEGWYTKY